MRRAGLVVAPTSRPLHSGRDDRFTFAIGGTNRNAPVGMTVLVFAIDETNRNAPVGMTD